MKRMAGFILLCLIIFPARSGGEEPYEACLNKGIRNADAYSYVLIEQSREKRAEASALLKKALTYSPDLPAVYFELSKASFSFSASGTLDSIDYIFQGINAYSRNFLWSFVAAGSVFLGVILSFVCAIAVIIAIRLFGDAPLLAHDMRENPSRAFLLLGLIVVSIPGPFLFLLGLLILLGLYMKKTDRVVVYLFCLFLFLSPLVFKTASLFFNTLTSAKVKAIVAVNEAKDNNYALSVLNTSDDYAALFSHALALKREGHYDEAIAVYNRLLENRQDPRVYVNLGNCYVGLYNFEEGKKYNLEEAMKYYVAAASIKPLASEYYNLSQISREMLDFTKGDEYFRSALALDRVAVAGYRAVAGRNPNRLTMDETLTFSDLWDYVRARPNEVSLLGITAFPPPVISLLAFLLLASFYSLDRSLKQRAYRCRKCDTILCALCEKRLMWGQMCPRCYGSLIKLDEIDVRERVARLLSIYERQRKRRDAMKILSFILPGSAQIYAGRILYGFLFLWPFLFFLSIPLVNSIFVTESTFFSHDFLNYAALFMAVIVYGFSNLITRRRIARGWL